MEILKIDPNFYVSEPYLKYSKVHGVKFQNKWAWLEDGDWILFPPIPLFDTKRAFHYVSQKKPIWSDFSNLCMVGDLQILDQEYIFNPQDFLNMKGGKWEVFRKNIRKWPKLNTDWRYTKALNDVNELRILLATWLEYKGDVTQDAEIIAQFVLSKDKDVHKSYLYDGKGFLAAVNVWDENYRYINYRLCITRRGEPYLEEFVRFLFYTSEEITVKDKLVNDGGVLDSPGLEHFKDKMNPVRKRIVYQTKTNKNDTD